MAPYPSWKPGASGKNSQSLDLVPSCGTSQLYTAWYGHLIHDAIVLNGSDPSRYPIVRLVAGPPCTGLVNRAFPFHVS